MIGEILEMKIIHYWKLRFAVSMLLLLVCIGLTAGKPTSKKPRALTTENRK